MTFAEKLRQARDAASLTQAALAAACGLSLGVIRDYEQGKKEPSLRSAFKLADALGVTVEAFAGSVTDLPIEPPPKKGKPKKAPSVEAVEPESPAPVKAKKGKPKK